MIKGEREAIERTRGVDMIGARRIGSCDAQQRHSARAGRRAGQFDAKWQAAAGDGWNIHALLRHDMTHAKSSALSVGRSKVEVLLSESW